MRWPSFFSSAPIDHPGSVVRYTVACLESSGTFRFLQTLPFEIVESLEKACVATTTQQPLVIPVKEIVEIRCAFSIEALSTQIINFLTVAYEEEEIPLVVAQLHEDTKARLEDAIASVMRVHREGYYAIGVEQPVTWFPTLLF